MPHSIVVRASGQEYLHRHRQSTPKGANKGKSKAAPIEVDTSDDESDDDEVSQIFMHTQPSRNDSIHAIQEPAKKKKVRTSGSTPRKYAKYLRTHHRGERKQRQ